MFKDKKYLSLIAGFSIIIGLMIALAITSLQKASSLSNLTTKLYDHPLAVSNAVLEIDSNIISMHRYMKDVALAKNQGELKLAISKVNTSEQKILKLFDIILERFLGNSSRIINARQVFINWAPIRSEVIRLTQAGKFDEASAITKDKGAKYVLIMTDQMKDLVDFARAKAREFLKNSKEQYQQFKTVMLGLISGALAISFAIFLVILSSVKKADRIQAIAKSELRLAKEHLEEKVKERTSELSQKNVEQKIIMDELKLAKNEAVDANQAKSNFLSSMSHELRTPMNAILGFAQVLQLDKKEPLTARQTDSTHQIIKGGEHLLDLINDVLNFAKIESGEINLNVSLVDSQEVLDDCLPLMNNLNNPLEVTFDTSDYSGSMINVDRVRFKQILFNLMSNALKYNRKNGKVIISSNITDNNMYRIFVKDTGIGIPTKRQSDLFKPFSRLGAENSEIEGTGIGLTITKHLIEAMGGQISFESSVDNGSTFCVDLPLAHPGQINTPILVPEPINQTQTNFHGKILYVEDNPTNADLMETVIGNLDGIKLEVVGDAEMGIATAIQMRPDLILMDINLPGMNGIEALSKLRENIETADTPIIAISADVLPGEIEKAMNAGFLAYLTKPLNIPELLEQISDVLSENKT